MTQPHVLGNITKPPMASPDWLDATSVNRVRRALARRSMDRDASIQADMADTIDMVRTHISTVFLTTDHAFKFKRPVDVGFADFRTLASRRLDCEAEVRLNRRLAPGVYLNVEPLFLAGEDYTFEAVGTPVDYCVVMERLPVETMLDHRLLHGRISPADLHSIAQTLAHFHQSPPGSDGPDPGVLRRFGDLTVIRENWDENFRQTEHLVGTALSREDFEALRSEVEDFITHNTDLFMSRVEGGFIRDGHGDLRCEHIHLGSDGIKIIDCIAFNDRFRYGDTANDLSFLLMDLTVLGHPAYARILLEDYTALTGDTGMTRLIPFYACYRAYVRGKVTGFKLSDPNLTPTEREAVLTKAITFFQLARAFAAQMRPPLLVLMAGLMGTGKSSLAAALAKLAGVAHHDSDSIRKALAAKATGVQHLRGNEPRAPALFGEGLYTPAWNKRTYAALLAEGEAALNAGCSVILDASFSRRADRERAQALAARLGAEAVLVECAVDDATVLTRLNARWASGKDPSDGRAELYPHQKAAFESITEEERLRHFTVITDKPPESVARDLLHVLNLPPRLFNQADV